MIGYHLFQGLSISFFRMNIRLFCKLCIYLATNAEEVRLHNPCAPIYRTVSFADLCRYPNKLLDNCQYITCRNSEFSLADPRSVLWIAGKQVWSCFVDRDLIRSSIRTESWVCRLLPGEKTF